MSNAKSKIRTNSECSFVVSEADMDQFDKQVKDATTYVKRNQRYIRKMVRFRGVKGVVLDFGIELRNVMIHSDFLPPKFLQAIAKSGVTVELSHYPPMRKGKS